MNTQTTERKKTLIKIYRSVCYLREYDRRALLAGYGAESSTELTEAQLLEIIEKLQQEPNLWRRRVIAAVGAWLRSVNREENLDVIKAIACRAGSAENFNKITLPSLRRVYYEFVQKAKVSTVVNEINTEEILKQQNFN